MLTVFSLYLCEGSGHFSVTHSPSNLAQVTYSDTDSQVQVLPQKDGQLVVELTDLCLTARHTPRSTVHLAGVNTIQLTVRDKVSTGLGDSNVIASVRFVV